jgi:dTDP-4-amino-4,6-dideoxygalactose transaminase
MHPFHDLKAGYLAQQAEILAAVKRTLDSGRYILGAEVAAFEQEFARYLGLPHVIGTANATESLQLALLALDIGAGDDVVVPALTAAPTAMAVSAVGARPVFADIDPATYSLSARSLERALTPRTRAVIPVHLYGQCAAMDDLAAVLAERSVPIIEDCAQAHGAKDRGRMAGSMGVIACYSFYPTKNLGAFGDAGAVATADDRLAEALRRLRNYGQVENYDFYKPGLNSRLDELHAAILRVRLKVLEQGNARRRLHAERYRAGVKNPRITLPVERAGCHHVYHQFVVRCAARDRLRAHLRERAIETLIHYPRALHLATAFAGRSYYAERPIESERAVAEIVSLPIYPEMPEAMQADVIAALNAFSG